MEQPPECFFLLNAGCFVEDFCELSASMCYLLRCMAVMEPVVQLARVLHPAVIVCATEKLSLQDKSGC